MSNSTHPTTAQESTRDQSSATHAEYRAYKNGYYRGMKRASNGGKETQGFLIGAILVLSFGLGGLIAYLILQDQPLDFVPDASAPQENVEPESLEPRNSPEISQPNINVTITESSPNETAGSDAATERETSPSIPTSINSGAVTEDQAPVTTPSETESSRLEAPSEQAPTTASPEPAGDNSDSPTNEATTNGVAAP